MADPQAEPESASRPPRNFHFDLDPGKFIPIGMPMGAPDPPTTPDPGEAPGPDVPATDDPTTTHVDHAD